MAWIGVLFLASALVSFALVDNWIDSAVTIALFLLAGVFLVIAAVRGQRVAKPVDSAELGRIVAGGTVILGAAAGYRAVIGPLEEDNVLVTMETAFPAAGLILMATVLRGFLAMFAAGSKRLNLSIGAAGLTLVAWAISVFMFSSDVSPYAFLGIFVVFLGTIIQDVCSRERGTLASDTPSPTETGTEKAVPT